MTGEDWDKAEGSPCVRCRSRVLRLIAGLCARCINHDNEESVIIQEFRSRFDEGKVNG